MTGILNAPSEQYPSGSVTEKATMEKPDMNDSSTWWAMNYRDQYNAHLSSLRTFPAQGFPASDYGKEIEYEYGYEVMPPDRDNEWQPMMKELWDTFREERRRIIAVPVAKKSNIRDMKAKEQEGKDELVGAQLSDGTWYHYSKALTVRNNFQNNLPVGDVSAFDLIKVIKQHLIELDELIDGLNPSTPPVFTAKDMEAFAEWVSLYMVPTEDSKAWMRSSYGMKKGDIPNLTTYTHAEVINLFLKSK